jgi:hypothetical protein
MMELRVGDVRILEQDGTVVLAPAGAPVPGAERLRIWFDCNCPYCRRHWIENLQTYLDRASEGALELHMTPVAFLTQYSVEIGTLLLAAARLGAGAKLFFEIFEAAIFHGIGESLGNNPDAVDAKVKEIYEGVIRPALTAGGTPLAEFQAALSQVKDAHLLRQNTDEAARRGINGVPHIERL